MHVIVMKNIRHGITGSHVGDHEDYEIMYSGKKTPMFLQRKMPQSLRYDTRQNIFHERQ